MLLPACETRSAQENTPAAAPPLSDPSGQTASPLPEREEFVRRGLLTDASSREALRAGFGEPEQTDSEVVPNRHVPGVVDTLFTLRYPDLTVRIHRPGGGGELLSQVEVSSDRHLRFPAISLSRQDLADAFGAPDEASDSSVTYYCNTCEAADDPVHFFFDGQRVSLVRFDY